MSNEPTRDKQQLVAGSSLGAPNNGPNFTVSSLVSTTTSAVTTTTAADLTRPVARKRGLKQERDQSIATNNHPHHYHQTTITRRSRTPNEIPTAASSSLLDDRPPRSASAMASSCRLGPADEQQLANNNNNNFINNDMDNNHSNENEPINADQQQQSRGSTRPLASSGAGGKHLAASGTSNQRIKTTRVRINSTSEQIQDPNWLIQMEQLQLQHQQQKRMGNQLRQLHQKLKMSIGGSKSSAASANNNCIGAIGSLNQNVADKQQAYGNNLALTNQQSTQLASSLQQTPTTPIKVPVSILKQPSTSSNGQLGGNNKNNFSSKSPSPSLSSRHQQQQQQHSDKKQPNQVAGSSSSQFTRDSKSSGLIGAPRKVPISGATCSTHHQLGDQQQQLAQTKRHQLLVAGNLTVTTTTAAIVQSSAGSPNRQQALPTTGGSPMLSGDAAQTISSQSKRVPICADGQVRVSGWKRNNLLAKTLSHFDAIRGNQRPVFVPTKISLLQTDLVSVQSVLGDGQSVGTTTTTLAKPQPPLDDTRDSTSASQAIDRNQNKFANIVRDAILKKKLAKGGSINAMNVASFSPAKRFSDSNYNETLAASHQTSNELLDFSAANCKQTRSVSADPGANNNVNQYHYQRSSQSSLHSSIRRHPQTGPPQVNPPPTQARSHHHESIPMAQLLAAASASEAGSVPASSRALKLQLKNEQVLQNLRRQSNEMIHLQQQQQQQQQQHQLNYNNEPLGGKDANQLSPTAASAAPGSNSTPLRDWKRLTNKLGLLTGFHHHHNHNHNHNHYQYNKSAGHQPATVRSASGTPPSGSRPASPGAGCGPLRLTVSNQESGGRGWRCATAGSAANPATGQFLSPFDQRVGQQQQQQPISSSNGPRKLSSSSMIVVGGSAAAATTLAGATTSCSNFYTASPMASHSSKSDSNTFVQTRRSSDSEAYQHQHQHDYLHLRQQHKGASDNLATPPANQVPATMLEPKRPVVVVNRDDLLQLIQVTAANSGNLPSGANPAAASPAIHLATNEHQKPSHSQSSSSTESPLSAPREFKDVKLCEQIFDSKNEAQEQVQPTEDILVDVVKSAITIRDTGPIRTQQPVGKRHLEGSELELANNGDADTSDKREPLKLSAGCAMDQNELVRGAQTSSSKAIPSSKLSSPREHFSWVVKRTSKVATFQKNLRKMRWNSKRQPEKVTTDDGGACVESQAKGSTPKVDGDEEARGEDSKEGSAESKIKSGDVFVDPTLIGDAIEIFLRTTMQQQQLQQQQQDHQQHSDGPAKLRAAMATDETHEVNRSAGCTEKKVIAR